MELKSVFEIVKADRYSQEGCDKINAEATEDKKYNTGDISNATGLQKQPDGSWAPPKATKYGKVTTNKNGEVGIQQTLGKGSKFEKFADEKSASRALANLTAGYNTTERSKEDPHSDKARLAKHWNKETDQIRKENRQARRDLNNNVQSAGPERDISAENRAAHEKADKERAARTAKAEAMASTARQEAETRKLSGLEMKDFFLGKSYEGASVEMAQRGLEAQGFDLLEANDKINVYERPEGGRITMQLEGNKIKSADYKTPDETKADRTLHQEIEQQREKSAAGSTEEIGRFYTKFDDAQSAYDAGRQTFPEGGYTIFKTPTGQYKVVDDPKTKQRMTAAGYEVEVDVPEGTKPPKSPAENSTSETKPKREAVSSRRMQKDLDGNFWSRPEDFKEDITSRGWDVEEMNNEYAVISNEAGSQYEVRFDDHSDDGDLTVRTFKPLMIDEDDDDGPEDAAPKLTGDTRIKVRK